ncbi:MAG: RNA-binding protein S1 [Clostridiales bacterium]|nr:MAG: RNA-binding protein S1 [Clostridiales bacterium]
MAQVGQTMSGKVGFIKEFGAFIDLENGEKGLVHISEISNEFVSNVKDFLTEGQEVLVKVVNIDDKGRINLSIKKAESPVQEPKKPQMSFEDMMAKFKQDSESKLADMKQPKDGRKSAYAKRK